MKREARLVSLLMGYLEDEDDGKWAAISSSLLSRNSAAENARVIVCWAAISDEHGGSRFGLCENVDAK